MITLSSQNAHAGFLHSHFGQGDTLGSGGGRRVVENGVHLSLVVAAKTACAARTRSIMASSCCVLVVISASVRCGSDVSFIQYTISTLPCRGEPGKECRTPPGAPETRHEKRGRPPSLFLPSCPLSPSEAVFNAVRAYGGWLLPYPQATRRPSGAHSLPRWRRSPRPACRPRPPSAADGRRSPRNPCPWARSPRYRGR